MAISRIGVGAFSASDTNGATVTYAFPAGYSQLPGDLCLVVQTGWASSSTAGPTPSGYTLRDFQARVVASFLIVSVHYKFLSGSDTAPQVTVPAAFGSTSLGLGGFTVIYRGAHNSSTFSGSGNKNSSAAAATFTTGTLGVNLPASVPAQVYMAVASGDDNTLSLTTAASWTARASGSSYQTTLGLDHSAAFADQRVTSVATITSGVWTQTVNGTDSWVSWADAILEAALPGDVTGLTATEQSLTSVKLDWTAPAANGAVIYDYLIEQSTDGVNYSTVSDGVSTNVTYTVTGLTSGTKYWWRVKAINGVGNSANYSNVVTYNHISGSSATTQANNTSTASAVEKFIGTSAQTQANNTSTASGLEKFTGTSAQTQADNTPTASGLEKFTGTSAQTQANNTSAVTALEKFLGTLAKTQDDNTSSASGSVTAPPTDVTGTVAITQDSQTATAGGSLVIRGTASVTQSDNSSSVTAKISFIGTVSITQDSNTSSASGTSLLHPVYGTSSNTQDDNTVSGTGILRISGSISAQQADNTSSASGKLSLLGTVSALQEGNTSLVTALESFIGEILATQDDNTASGSGFSVKYLSITSEILVRNAIRTNIVFETGEALVSCRSGIRGTVELVPFIASEVSSRSSLRGKLLTGE